MGSSHHQGGGDAGWPSLRCVSTLGDETPVLQEQKLPSKGAHTTLLPTDHLPGTTCTRRMRPLRKPAVTQSRGAWSGWMGDPGKCSQKAPLGVARQPHQYRGALPGKQDAVGCGHFRAPRAPRGAGRCSELVLGKSAYSPMHVRPSECRAYFWWQPHVGPVSVSSQLCWQPPFP